MAKKLDAPIGPITLTYNSKSKRAEIHIADLDSVAKYRQNTVIGKRDANNWIGNKFKRLDIEFSVVHAWDNSQRWIPLNGEYPQSIGKEHVTPDGKLVFRFRWSWHGDDEYSNSAWIIKQWEWKELIA